MVLGCRDNSWDIFCDNTSSDLDSLFLSMSKLTFGVSFCQTIAKRSDLIVQIGQSAPFGRVLFRALARTLAVCKTLRRTHIYEVKYSALYFTWKLAEICAKILTRMLPP